MLSAFAVYNSNSEKVSGNAVGKSKKRKLHKKQSHQIKKKLRTKPTKLKDTLNKVLKHTERTDKQDKSEEKKFKFEDLSRNCKLPKAVPVTNIRQNKSVSFTNLEKLEPSKNTKSTPKSKQRKYNQENVSFNGNGVDDEILEKPLHLLNFLLAPIKTSIFFNTYWEKKPFYIVRNRPDYFKNILTSKQIDLMLRENLLYFTKNVDVVTYDNGERQTHNPEGRAIPASVWDYYMNGCSVRIMNPQTYNQKVRDLLSTLQEYFGTMVGVNVYLTPPGSQGFAPHYDDIEAFVLQLEGHKNWKIYSPRNDDETLPRYSSQNLSRNDLQEPLKELTLHAGDLLYFPRGFIHEASTDADAHSLHITVSVYQNTSYIDLLEKMIPQALKTVSEHDVNFRKGLPLNYLKHLGVVNSDKRTPERKEILDAVKELVCKLVDNASIDMAADQLGRKFMYEALPPQLSLSERERSCKEDGDRLDNGVVTNVVSFNPDTMVRLTRYYSQRLVLEDNKVKMYYCTENANVYHGEEEQYLELDTTLVETIKALHNNYPQYVSIENLPGSGEVEKIQVISDLWEKGLIITKEPLEKDDE